MIDQFHFLRPGWLLALIVLGMVLWLLRRRGYESGNWRAVIDARLLPHVLSTDGGRSTNRLPWILGVVTMLAIIALAGPTWEKRQQSMYQQHSALVVALDLSRSMDATDIRPTRLTRARHKIADILNLRAEGQSALVVYAADAFAVTPLTSDVETILALLPDLETGLMPAQGTRADRALERALELFDNSAVRRGDVLLVTDGISDLEVQRIEALLDKHPGQRLSVLAIGTGDGGPVPLKNGGFLKDSGGDIVITRLNAENMHHIVNLGSGAFATISSDDIDINTLNYIMESGLDDSDAQLSDSSADLWRELGPTLLLFALPLAALAFRRGLIWIAPIFLLVLPPEADAVDWKSLWQNSDQQALQLYQQGQHQQAAELFNDQAWQATAKYHAGDYSAAAEGWQRQEGEDAEYNHANALAQQGRYPEALAAYDRLLEQNPEHQDARFNRQAIEDWLKQQQQQQQQQQQDGQSQQQQPGDSKDGQQQQQSGESEDGQQQGQQSAREADEPGDGESLGNEPGDESTQDGQGSEAPQAGDDQARDEAADGQSAEQSQQVPQAGESEAQQDSDSMANLDQQMSEQAAQQWLRKIPDDPGGLLRRKFLYQYRQRGDADKEAQTW
jgi:Ca-activated chloride channel family protein